MAYTRVRDESPEAVGIGNEEPESGLLRTTTQLYFYRNFFFLTFLLWIVTLAVLGWLFISTDRTSRNHAATLLPFDRIPTRIVNLNPDPRFHFTAFLSGNPAWSSLMPNDGGIVSVEHPGKYRLLESYKSANNSNAEVYSMSMFHQLHCLNSVRIRLGLLEGYMNETDAQIHSRNVFLPESHIDHCFDYLRQAIMCAGDLSLEHSVVPDEFGFNGWGTAHQCADWSSMWDIAVKLRYNQANSGTS